MTFSLNPIKWQSTSKNHWNNVQLIFALKGRHLSMKKHPSPVSGFSAFIINHFQLECPRILNELFRSDFADTILLCPLNLLFHLYFNCCLDFGSFLSLSSFNILAHRSKRYWLCSQDLYILWSTFLWAYGNSPTSVCLWSHMINGRWALFDHCLPIPHCNPMGDWI